MTTGNGHRPQRPLPPCPKCQGDGYTDDSTLTKPLFCDCLHGARVLLGEVADLAPMANQLRQTIWNYHDLADLHLSRGRFTHLATGEQIDQASDRLLAHQEGFDA